jgi:hypothetical protein
MQAAEQKVPGEIIANNPRDFWDDETNLEGGELVVRDADGNVITTLIITGNNLEAWLVDADVEKKDESSKGEESGS